MSVIQKVAEHTVYESPPSRQPPLNARFAGVVQVPSGDLLATFQLTEIIDVTIAHTFMSRSSDRGRTWQFQGPMYDTTKLRLDHDFDDAYKATVLADGSLIAFGYRFDRPDLDTPIVNPATGGFLPGANLVSFSSDEGRTWTLPEVVDTGRPELIETSGPCVQLRNGDLVAIGPPFALHDGSNPSGQVGVLLRSKDRGRTWDGSTVYYDDRVNKTSPWESRLCEMQDGRLVLIVWAYCLPEDTTYTNRVVWSEDNGHTWSDPIDTGHPAQASNLMWIEKNLLLTIHSRRAAADPGLYVRLVDFTGNRWKELEIARIWGTAVRQDPHSVDEQMQGLQFGQPSLLRLDNGDILATHWGKEGELAKIKTHRLKLNL